jgi:hypothetical protein
MARARLRAPALTQAYKTCNIYAMRRTSLFLDDQLTKKLQKLARSRGVSFATVVREALAQYLAVAPSEQALPSIAGRFSSGHSDTAERADELLWRDPHA